MLGANDGIVSISSLIVGVAASHAARVTYWGALAMAATAGIGYLFSTVVCGGNRFLAPAGPTRHRRL